MPIYFYLTDANVCTIDFRGFQLEEGEVATDCTPNIGEYTHMLNERIKNTELKIEPDAITATVMDQATDELEGETLAGYLTQINNAIGQANFKITKDSITSAVMNQSQETLLYFDNIYDKQVYRKNGSEYIRSPFKLLCNENNYYLLAYDATAMEIRTYRVDRMAKVQLLDCPRQGWDAYNKIRISEYLEETFNMYGNGHKEKIVTMIFHNCLSNVVIDQFGQDVHMMYEDDEHFRITVKVNVNEQFFGWIFGLGDDVRITAPQSVIDEMSTMLHKIYDNYDSGI